MSLKFKVQKVVVSMGLGNRSAVQIEKVVQHFGGVFRPVLQKNKTQRCVITRCKKSNAKFKIRKGAPCGVKLTLRKVKARDFLLLLKERLKSFLDAFVYNKGALFWGIQDHRLLRLQKYNYEAPQYGFNVAVVFKPVSNRVYTRRIGAIKKKRVPEREPCVNLLEEFLR